MNHTYAMYHIAPISFIKSIEFSKWSLVNLIHVRWNCKVIFGIKSTFRSCHMQLPSEFVVTGAQLVCVANRKWFNFIWVQIKSEKRWKGYIIHQHFSTICTTKNVPYVFWKQFYRHTKYLCTWNIRLNVKLRVILHID